MPTTEKKRIIDSPEVLLSFVTQTKEGKFGTVAASTPKIYHVEARREDLEEPMFYYSFR